MNIFFKRLNWIVLLGICLMVPQNIYCWGFPASKLCAGFLNHALRIVQAVPSIIKSSPAAKVGAAAVVALGAAGLATGCFLGLRSIVCKLRADIVSQQEEERQDAFAEWKKHSMLKRINDVAQNLPELAQDEFGYIEAKVLPAGSHIAVIGDLHGDQQSLDTDLQALRAQGVLDNMGHIMPGNYLVCLGDVADRGHNGVEAWQKLLELKRNNPDAMWIIRGNHEEAATAAAYGFWDELLLKFRAHANEVATAFVSLWKKLPNAVYLGIRNQTTGKVDYIQFCHGGIDTRLDKYALSAITHAAQYDIVSRRRFKAELIKEDKFDNFPECGLNWSDFYAKDTVEPSDERCQRSLKSCLRAYNAGFAQAYLRRMAGENFNVHCIVRGHDHVQGGIAELRDQIAEAENDRKLKQWRPLQHDQVELIRPGAVFTCTSSPTGLGAKYRCLEDACAVINMDERGLQIRPHIAVKK